MALPKIPGEARRVNRVIRFPLHKKSPQDISPTGTVAQVLGLASLTDREVDFNSKPVRETRAKSAIGIAEF